MERKGLRVNMEKTKFMITGKESKRGVCSGRWPCGCCGKGVGVNSIFCIECKKWCHYRCSGLRKIVGVQNFRCSVCKKGNTIETDGGLNTTSGKIEEVDEFCYLGNVLDCEAGIERAVRARVAAAWKKWREMAGLLTNKIIPLKIRGSVFESCVRSVLLYGAETWAVTGKMEDIVKGCDRRMLRYMAGVTWQERLSSKEVAKRCGLSEVQGKMRQRRLQWFGHVKREEDGAMKKTVEELEVPGKRRAGRPRITWGDIVKRDMEKLGIEERMTMDRKKWKKAIASLTPA